MNNTKIWLSSPHMGGNEQKYIKEAFDTNWVAPLGPNVTGFEQDLEQFLNSDVHIAALSSGTAAIHLGLVLLGVKVGDEVICQSFTFSASCNPILYLGATPVFVDSEPGTWNMFPNVLEEAIIDRIKNGKKPKVIVPVHLYGMPFKADDIKAVADKYQIPILEDSAEALGSTYKGRNCGTFGDIAALSFNGNKIITTSGGGALVSHSKEIKDKTVFLATQARDAAPHYQHSEIGYNYRLSNICAGIGRGQMEVLQKHINLRREMHDFYADFFKDIKEVTVFNEPNADYFSNHWLSCIVIDSNALGKTSIDLRLALEKENIECRPLWKPMHLQPIFEKYPYYGDKVCEQLFENGLCLPSGSNMTKSDKKRISDALSNFFNIF
jgi:dTDP-4-amino-4,6-dideoxygalactose transaminase